MARQDRKSDAEGGFLSRWSERKRGGEDAAGEEPAPPAAGSGDSTAEETWSEDEIQEKLAEIDGMEQGDDFKPLLAAAVPEIVKKAALRKLWRSNPVFGVLDGLNDYDLDYTLKPGVIEQVRSAYQAGKGYVYEEEAESERQTEIAERRQRDRARAPQRAPQGADSEAPETREESAEPDTAAESPRKAEAPAAGAARQEPPAEAAKPRGNAAARRWGGKLG
jgi:hypothetical protein